MFRLTRMKLDRAKQRMKELAEALQSFYATNPFKFSGKHGYALKVAASSFENAIPSRVSSIFF